jgi:hypothetical protein
MTNLNQWAARWRIPPEALADLRVQLGVDTDPRGTRPPPGSEAAVQAAQRLRASEQGGRLWRNNVGVAADSRTGRPVRFGLANDSAALNRQVKSSDLIGIRPITIRPGDIGRVIGQFWSVECKRPGWKYSGTARERAQLAWHLLVISFGGDAYFVDSGDNKG